MGDQLLSPSLLSPSNLHQRQHSSSSSSSFSPELNSNGGPSAKSLLRQSSYTSTVDSETAESPQPERGEVRQRNGVKSKVQQWWPGRPHLRQRTSTVEGHFAHGKPGWWGKQMLVDRSLRSMAGFTTLCALIIFIIIFSYLPQFRSRLNLNSTSVGGRTGESCKTLEKKNVVCMRCYQAVFKAKSRCRQFTCS